MVPPMLARRFVCPTCGNETEFPAAYAEGEAPVCCGFEMVELVPDPPVASRQRRPRMPRSLSRRFWCPRCQAGPGELCKRGDGSTREPSHAERVRHADQVMAKTRAERAARGLDPIPPRRA